MTLETATWLMEYLPAPVTNLGMRLFGLDWPELVFLGAAGATAVSRWARLACWSVARVVTGVEHWLDAREHHKLAARLEADARRREEMLQMVQVVLDRQAREAWEKEIRASKDLGKKGV